MIVWGRNASQGTYLEAGVLVGVDDAQDDEASNDGDGEGDHGQLAVVSCGVGYNAY